MVGGGGAEAAAACCFRRAAAPFFFLLDGDMLVLVQFRSLRHGKNALMG